MEERSNDRRAFLKKAIGLAGVLGLATMAISTSSCQKSGDGVYTVNSSLCTGCQKCVSVCSAGAISFSNSKASISSSKCVGCGKCARVCPSGAISQA